MAEAQRFIGLATGTLVRLETHLDAYIKTLEPTPKRRGLKPRTIFQRRSTLEKFFVRFPYAGDVTRKAVQKWIDEMDAAGLAPDSIKKTVGEVRSFWEYLQQQEVVSDEDSTFDKVKRPTGKNDGEERRLPFTPEDVVALHRQAVANGDPVLADLIFLGAYTGARVESLCVLKDSDVNTSDWSFRILSDKTKAGRRVVPIHTELRPVILRLMDSTKDGYLLPGLKEDKWGDRSSNIRVRFGTLKTAMGFGEQHVFHSLRKTVSTFFDQNNVSESVAADIVGHKKKTMTYGVYSGGTSLEQRHQAIEVIRYPW
jgi:integrase